MGNAPPRLVGEGEAFCYVVRTVPAPAICYESRERPPTDRLSKSGELGAIAVER